MILSKERQEQILEVIFNNMLGGFQDVYEDLKSHFERHNEIVEQAGIKEEEEPPIEYNDERFNEPFRRYEERQKNS